MGFDHTNPAHVEKLAELLGPHLGRHVRDHVRSALSEMVEPMSPGHEEPDGDEGAMEEPPSMNGAPGKKPPMAKAGELDEPEDTEESESEPEVVPDDDEDMGREEYGEMEQPDDDMDDMEYEGAPDEEVEDEEEVEPRQRTKYMEGEVGGNSTVIPKMENSDPRRKKTMNGVSRKQYQQDFGAVSTVIEDLYEQLGRLTHERDRLLYRQNLEALKKEEGFELDIDEEVAELPIDAPADFIEKRQAHIRKCYRRTIVSQPTVPVGEAKRLAEPISEQQMIRARGYATAKRVDFDTACKELGFRA
jgi:hypothetical protein